jgi:hypothetical protein
MTKEEIDSINKEYESELKEMEFWYGSWDEVRKVINQLEDNDREAAWERHVTDY